MILSQNLEKLVSFFNVGEREKILEDKKLRTKMQNSNLTEKKARRQ